MSLCVTGLSLKKLNRHLNKHEILTMLLVEILAGSVVKNNVTSLVIRDGNDAPGSGSVLFIPTITDESGMVVQVLKNQWSFSHRNTREMIKILGRYLKILSKMYASHPNW